MSLLHLFQRKRHQWKEQRLERLRTIAEKLFEKGQQSKTLVKLTKAVLKTLVLPQARSYDVYFTNFQFDFLYDITQALVDTQI